MRNYIILNDNKSDPIEGLLISTLPPISKPRKRVEIEEIDGRNGDIITDLGYAAYDKTISIGLYGKYDVDDIIQYFDSEGTVTFSNEPDKYYYYKIIEQIDFSKLIRYKTADVVFHVQPFKYSTLDTKKTFQITNETSIQIRNNGNIYSKPVITIYGSGTINLSLNNEQMFVIDLSNDNQITLDIENMNAYNQETDVFKNRLVTGNYDNFKLNIGINTISWTGTVTKIEIEDYTRFI